MKTTILLALSVTAVMADTAPVIPDSLSAKFWRAQAQLVAVLLEFQAKEAAVKAAKAELDAVCGEKHVLVDQDGLKCIQKPKKTEEVKPK